MAKLILKYEAAVLKEVPLNKASLTIGRTPGNDLVIDNLAVSGHHAKIFFESDKFVLEDLNSLNGTFLNNQRVRKSYLKNGDEVLIGKHTLIYHDEGPPPEIPLQPTDQTVPVAKLEQTVVLDTRQRREFLQKATAVAEGGASPAAVDKVACLIVLSGKTDQQEYILTSKLSMIGKSPMASVKLRGWFKPDVAAVVNKRGGGYQIATSGNNKVKVNGQAIDAPRDLQEGDVIEVSGIQLRFNYRE